MNTCSNNTLVVGGGPAGSACAWRLACSGRPCTVLEKMYLPRDKVCGGILSYRASSILTESGMLTFDELERITLREHLTISFWHNDSHVRTYFSHRHPVRIVSRSAFDSLLLGKAETAGAVVQQGSRVESVSGSEVITSDGKRRPFRNLVGADGCTSLVRKMVSGRRSRRSGMGFQDSVPLEDFPRQPLGLEIHFGRLRYGYIWVFPDNERVRIGAGVLGSPASPSDVVNTLTEFMRNLHLPTSELQLQGAPIPSLVLSEDLGRDNLYLAGDAAGMVDHVSGEGMGHALESGLLVAQCILASGRRENVLGSAGNCISLVKESIRYRHLLYSRLTRGVAMMSLRDSEIFAECYWDIISGIGTYDDMFRRILE